MTLSTSLQWSCSVSIVCIVTKGALLLTLVASFTAVKIDSMYEDGHTFQKMLLVEESGAVFVGAQNRLHRLSLGLVAEQVLELGPRLDDYSCSGPSDGKCTGRVFQDERVKVLLKHPARNELLLCGNLYRGACAKVSTENVSDIMWMYESVVGVAGDDLFSSTAAVLTANSVLFVGNSVDTRNGSILPNKQTPLLATLSYANLTVQYPDQYTVSRLNLELGVSFRAIHRTAFIYKGATYFLVTAEAATGSGGFETYISRTCQTDPAYWSYVNAPLKCVTGTLQFNMAEAMYVGVPGFNLLSELGLMNQEELLYVVFSRTVGKTLKRNHDSDFCAYRLSVIHDILTQAIQLCYQGMDYTRPPHLTTPTECVHTKTENAEDYCGKHPQNLTIRSVFPVLRRAFVNTLLSAVVVSADGPNTLLYLGTRKGSILKVEVQNRTHLTLSDTIQIVPHHPVLPDMHLSSDNAHLYAMTHATVVRIQTLQCDSSTTCARCMELTDPHCGWCIVSNRCSPRAECGSDGTAWIRAGTALCPAIVSMSPTSVHTGTPIKLNLTLTMTPVFGMTYECLIGSVGRKVRATGTLLAGSIIQCQTGQTWPPLPTNQSFVKIRVDLEAGGNRLLSTAVTVYDCTSNHRCTDCITSTDPCAWCTSSARCADAPTVHLVENCGKEIVVYAKKFPAKRTDREPEHCPQIEPPTDHGLLLHAGIPANISLRGLSLPLEILHQRTYCRLGNVEVDAVVARIDKHIFNVTCTNVKLSYQKDVPFHTLPLSVLWGQKKNPLDIPRNFQLRLYNCMYLATNCGQCLTLAAHFKCGECEGHCSHRETCPTTWHGRGFICPNPLLTRVQPLSGPVGGGTPLTIHGINLGHLASHIVVTVANRTCHVLDYTLTTSVVCRIPPAPTQTRAPIIVTVADKFVTTATDMYHYVDPVFEALHPYMGPRAGGTLVTLTGRALDSGASLQVELQSMRTKRQAKTPGNASKWSTPAVLSRTDREVKFETQPVGGAGDMELRVVLVIDGTEFSQPKTTFVYRNDPTVLKVTPTLTLLSGGVELTVQGTELGIIQRPRLVVYIPPDQRLLSECEMVDNQMDTMICLTPQLGDLDLDEQHHMTLNYGFLMDNVTSLLEVSGVGRSDLEPLQVYPDPSFDPLTTKAHFDLEKPLTLTGRHLGVLAHLPGIIVTVGGTPCNLTEVNETAMTCTPTAQPQWLNAGRAEVLLVVGQRKVLPGWMLVPRESFSASLPLILAVVVGPILVIAIILGVCLCRRHRHEKRKKIHRPPAVELEDPTAISLTSFTAAPGGKAHTTELTTEAEITPTELTPLAAANSVENLPESRSEPGDDDNNSSIGDDVALVMSLLGYVTDRKLRQTVEDMLVPSAHLTLGDVLGKGHFGCVYSGLLKVPDSDEPPIKVAIKRLQGQYLDSEVVECFLKEGVMMKHFDHPHVLRLLGVTITPSGGNPLVILPYMSCGDLRNYIKDKKRSFTARQLLYLAQQVAEGMAYLSSRGFIHRDLAARNCMVDEEECVKVADFGLSKDLFEKDYYNSMDRKRKMPIKWMALESLEDYVFTTKSDVWSFGVLLWELMIRGVTPYPDVDAFEMRNYLASGRRLRQPKFCPDNAYALMAECWCTDPDERPTFADLVNNLEMIVNPSRPVGHDMSDASDEPLYVNIQRQPSADDSLRMPEAT